MFGGWDECTRVNGVKCSRCRSPMTVQVNGVTPRARRVFDKLSQMFEELSPLFENETAHQQIQDLFFWERARRSDVTHGEVQGP